MIISNNDFTKEIRENMRGGDGSIVVETFVSPEELCGKGRLFGRLTIKPGCGIGYHVHEGDAELFYILSGTGTYSDNGEIKTVSAGQVTVTPSGTGHSIKNESCEDLVLIALIVYSDK